MVKILICNCENNFQDKQYGKNKRVMNHSPKKNATPYNYRCTVCGKQQTIKVTIKSIEKAEEKAA